ncbi:hypothetical protein Tco_0787170 [Tanacetum coccineum]
MMSRTSHDEIQGDVKGKAKTSDEDLSKPFKEVLKCPFTRRILSPGHKMSANAKIYDGTGDPEDHVGRFVRIGNQGEWPMPMWCRMFQQTLDGKARACSHKCPELAKRFSDNIPKTVDEMLKRVDDYLRLEEAFCSTELPKGEVPERHALYVPPQRPHQEFHHPNAILTLDSLLSTPQEILATVGVPSKENLNRYCDYHNEKGHNTNDCFHLKWQLEIAVESGKLNHLVKDARQRGKVGQQSNGLQKAKVINMVQYQKRKTTMTDEEWMNVPIIFPPVPARDLSEEALVVKVEVEGYLIRRIHIDEEASIKIMFEQCFNMLHLSIRSKLVETQTTVSNRSSRWEKLSSTYASEEQEDVEEQS